MSYEDRNYDRGYRSSNPSGSHGNKGHQRRGVPLSDLDPELTEVSRLLIGCAIEVHRTLGPGYPLDIYTKALCQELKEEEIDFLQNHEIQVSYNDEIIGTVTTDLFIDDKFFVKLMARPGEIGRAERSELRAFLKAGDLELGLIVNFAERRLKDGLVRVLNLDKINLAHEDEHHNDDDDDEYDNED